MRYVLPVVAASILGCGPTVPETGSLSAGEPTTQAPASTGTTSDDDGTSSDSSGAATTTTAATTADTSGGATDSSGGPATTGTLATTDESGDPVAPPMASANCMLSSYVEAELAQPELHIIGVYEGSGDHSVSAPAAVHVDRPGEVYLVVASYESVSWTITAAEGTTILEVILSGYESQSAMVPVGTTVVDRSGGNSPLSAAAFAWGDPETVQLVAAVEGLTGAELTSFHGCYQGSDFTLE